MSIRCLGAPLLVAVAAFGASAPADGAIPAFEEGTVQTRCGGTAVKSFGGTWIYAGAPDLLDDISFQIGNDSPREKVRPRRTDELRSNYFGVNTTRMPCLNANHDLPSEAVHLIDGDDQTCWLSEGQQRPDNQPIAVRIDLPVEREVAKVVLRKRPLRQETARRATDCPPAHGACKVGRGLPVALTLAVARDAYRWQTIFSGETGDTEDKETFEVSFPSRPVKQILLTATAMRKVEQFLYSASFAEIEVLDPSGRNLALASRGATVAVNATRHSTMPHMSQQRALWPVHWDSGLKWIRVGYHDDPINWHRVERVKGRLEVDPLADEAITDLKRHGANVIMCLDFGNRLYSGPEKRQFAQLPEWYWCMPNPPTTPEALAAWDRYVEFMCRHFRDRVHTFEIWNEWNISLYWGDNANLDAYCEIVRRTIPIIRQNAPGCQVMLGSTSGWFGGISTNSQETLERREKNDSRFKVWKRFAKDVDAIGYHPFYNPKPGSLARYSDDIRAFRSWLERQGFRGTLHASEWNINARYPSVDHEDARSVWCGTFNQTELQKAKEVVQHMVRHAGFGIPSCFCEAYMAFYAQTELSLFKGSLLQDPVTPLQPTPAYYVLRNAATIMDGMQPAGFRPEVAGTDRHVEAFAFADGNRRAVALWYEDAERADSYRQTPVTLTLPFEAPVLFAVDPVNGVRQRLDASASGGRTVVQGLMIGDAPLIVCEHATASRVSAPAPTASSP